MELVFCLPRANLYGTVNPLTAGRGEGYGLADERIGERPPPAFWILVPRFGRRCDTHCARSRGAEAYGSPVPAGLFARLLWGGMKPADAGWG